MASPMLPIDLELMLEILPDMKKYHVSFIPNDRTGQLSFLAQNKKPAASTDPQDLRRHDHFIFTLLYSERDIARLGEVVSFQNLARVVIPELVPQILKSGMNQQPGHSPVAFTIMSHTKGSVKVKDVWDDLDEANQHEIMDSLVEGLKKLHAVKRQFFDSYPKIGGPNGYWHDLKGFLRRAVEQDNDPATCEIIDLPTKQKGREGGGVAVQSLIEGVGRVELTQAELDSLEKQLVVCNCHITVDEIMVRPKQGVGRFSDSPRRQYELVSISAWDKAGFYPFACELAMKDAQLGVLDRTYTWYKMFKEKAVALLPQDCQKANEKLIEALWIIDRSKAVGMISVENEGEDRRERRMMYEFQKRWVAAHDLVRMGLESGEILKGWVAKDSSDGEDWRRRYAILSEEAKDKLSFEVCRDITGMFDIEFDQLG